MSLFLPFLIFLFGISSYSIRAFAIVPLQSPQLVVYANDFILAPGGLASYLGGAFEKKNHIKIKWIGFLDKAHLWAQLALDLKKSEKKPRLVLGVDPYFWSQIKTQSEDWLDWLPKGYSDLFSEAKQDPGFLPYEYGALTFMFDEAFEKKRNTQIFFSLYDFLKRDQNQIRIWSKKFILEDPRVSISGLIFLLYTKFVLKDSFYNFWKTIKKDWLALLPNWSAAYQLFLRKEAPLVWSYVSSQAFHDRYTDKDKRRYRALVLKEGYPLQVDGIVWLKSMQTDLVKKNLERKWVQCFLEWMISEDVQKMIPHLGYMMPVRKNIKLPSYYENLPKIEHTANIDMGQKHVDAVMNEWVQVIWN